MARRWKKRLLLSVGAIAIFVAIFVWLYDRSQMIAWVGGTDLEIEFVITDANSNTLIPGAQIEIHSEGGLYDEKYKQDFVLVADSNGMARKVCHGSMCFGKTSGFGFTDSYAVHLPFWYFKVTAPGYEPSELVELDSPEYARQARETPPRRAKLVVPITLQKRRS